MEIDIPFVTTYPPKVNQLGKLIRDLISFFYNDEEAQKFLSTPPMVSYRSVGKIKDYMVRSKMYPVERRIGC